MDSASKFRGLIALEGDALFDGESRRIDCPFCGSPKHTMRIRREGRSIIYVCFRASCGRKGAVTDGGEVLSSNSRPIRRAAATSIPLRRLRRGEYEEMRRRYGLSALQIDENGIRIAEDRGWLYLPVYGLYGAPRGYLLKSPPWIPRGRGLKVISTGVAGGIHYPVTGSQSGPIYVVEDILSSIRVARYHRCVALCGTHMSDRDAMELARETDELIFMLDEDTWHNREITSKKIAGNISLLFGTIRHLYCHKDPKDMDEDELKEVLSI